MKVITPVVELTVAHDGTVDVEVIPDAVEPGAMDNPKVQPLQGIVA